MLTFNNINHIMHIVDNKKVNSIKILYLMHIINIKKAQ